MREVVEWLEGSSIPYFLTGSEAMARYGQPRQTMDVDIVVELPVQEYARLGDAFASRFVVNPPIWGSTQAIATLVATSALGKVDLMIGRSDDWSRSAMARRQRWDHPELGPLWVISLEDLVLAKLGWPGGTSELQLRDCRNLIAVNRDDMDWPYLVAAGRRRWHQRAGGAGTLPPEAVVPGVAAGVARAHHRRPLRTPRPGALAWLPSTKGMLTR